MSELRGRRALVTGGAVRVGRALTLACAAEGMDVAVHYRVSAVEAEEVAAECRAFGVRAVTLGGDLTRPEECRQVAAEAEAGLGGVDVLVNSAANFVNGPVLEIPPERVRAAFALNVEAPFHLAQALAPGMIARGWGRIVNINDVAGLEPWPRFEIHSVSKAALLMLTKALAQALAPAVLVNGIAPGTVLMPEDAPPGATDRSAAKTVLGRVGSPQDVADALRYLLSADYVTGHTLVVDGGRMVRA